jgi:hypothetical protein
LPFCIQLVIEQAPEHDADAVAFADNEAGLYTCLVRTHFILSGPFAVICGVDNRRLISRRMAQ